MSLPIVAHPDYDARDIPSDHRFPMRKFSALAHLLQEREMVGAIGFHEPLAAPAAWLALAHDLDYVLGVLSANLAPAIARRIGFPMTAGIARRAQAATGGTVLAARLALAHGIACNAAGGSHHADQAGGAGFCVFNDVAVAIKVLQAEGAIRRVLVIDCDVHQGDGTARIFTGDSSVFTLSLHCEKNFPVRKAISDLDIGLAPGTGDDDYLTALDHALRIAFARFSPDLVFYNAGVDVHAEDKLGLLSLTDTGIAARDNLALDYCRRRGLPVVGVLGGGYGEDPTVIAARHAILFAQAATLATKLPA